MSRRQTRILSTLLAGAAVVALAPAHALAANATLAQGDDPYFKQAQAALQRILTQQPNTNRAKNVILIVGDGMGFSTVTAARIFEGQQRGVDGESNVLAWEAFPHLAASKTYSADAQITNSAPSAVAMTTGVKTINDVMGLDHTAKLDSCEDQKTKAVTTLWEMAESIGMSTGAVTTATITHATPGATYAHIANRDWESDAGDAARGARRRAARTSRASWSRSPTATASRSPWAAAAPTSCRTRAADPEDAGQEGQAQGRRGPDQGLARPLRRTAARTSGTSSSSISSTRPRSTTCSGSSRCRTWSTITTGRRTRPASPRSRRWPRRRSTSWPGTPRATC